MRMEVGKVAIFEDDPHFSERAARFIEMGESPHTVVATANTLDGALEVVGQIAEGELECNVVVLDGNLTPETADGRDARTITAAIRDAKLPVKIVGFSLDRMSAYEVEVSVDLGKQNTRDIRRVIDEL